MELTPEATDVRHIIKQYEDILEHFQNLEKNFSEEEPSVLLTNYEQCVLMLKALLLDESDLSFKPSTSERADSEFNNLDQLKADTPLAPLQATPPTDNSASKLTPPKAKRKKGNACDSRAEDRKEQIESTLRSVEGNGFQDIVGMESVKILLKNSVLLPLISPQLFTGGRRPWSQILLYGPPGTGKSRLVHALAHEAKATLYCVSSADLLSSWVGESEKMIKALFTQTRSSKEKCIVFIDEVDGICRKRSSKEGDHSRSVKNQLLIELDQNEKSECKCLIMCATNCPWDMDIAFLRRFQCKIFIPLPDSSTRIEIMKRRCEGVGVTMSAENWEQLGDRTEGYSGSDLVSLTNFALQEPLGEILNNHTWIISDDKWMPCPSNTPTCVRMPLSDVPSDKISVRNVVLKDFTKAIVLAPKTISSEELNKYNEFSTIK